MTRLLENKNAIVYGAGGGIGGGVARTFAREGAKVFLVGRTKGPLETVAAGIEADGGAVEVAVLDALDERAVDEHVGRVTKAGTVDISFNLITRGDIQQIPLVEMTTVDLMRAVTIGLTSNFITARAAARHMIKQGSGVILHLNSGSSRGTMPMMGSTGPADAATETFMRYLATEIGRFGVRVVGIYTAGGLTHSHGKSWQASAVETGWTRLMSNARSRAWRCCAARQDWLRSRMPRLSLPQTAPPESPAPSST